MNPLTLQAHLQAAREIVNDTNAFFYGDCPDPDCNCCRQVTDSAGVVFVHSILQITPQVSICGFKSGECGAHSMSHLLLRVDPRIAALATTECYWKYDGWLHLAETSVNL